MTRALERFWSACGARPPLGLAAHNRLDGRTAAVELNRPFAVLGRDPACDLVLESPRVSRRHAFAIILDGRLFGLDLDSRSALSWDGVPRRSGWIDARRKVEVGPFLVRPEPDLQPLGRFEPRDPLAPGSASGVNSEAPRFVLEAVDEQGRLGSSRWEIDRRLTVLGRAPECRPKLADLSVSRFHCVLVRIGAEFWVVDLLGRAGTRLNGEPVRWAKLEADDRLHLGRYEFAIRLEKGPGLRLLDTGAEGQPPPAPGTELRLHRSPAALRSASQPPPGPLEVAVGGALPVRVEEAWPELEGLVDPALAPLIHQFALMQQQIHDHYHQSMMEMVGLVRQVQEEQRAVVDRELKEIRRLTRQVERLRRKLAEQPEGPGANRSSDSTPSPNHAANEAAPKAIEPPVNPAPSERGTPEDYRAAHTRLLGRIQELQDERQSRWQRLMERLKGSDG